MIVIGTALSITHTVDNKAIIILGFGISLAAQAYEVSILKKENVELKKQLQTD